MENQNHMKNSPYEEIINHKHHISNKYPQMSMEKRAAQFMPFKALTGYDDEIEKTVTKHIEGEENA